MVSPSPPPDDSLWGACGKLLMNSLEENNSVARETTGEESELGESQNGDLARPLRWKKVKAIFGAHLNYDIIVGI